MQKLGTIERIAALYRDETHPAALRLCVAILFGGVLGATLLGRAGEVWSRPAAAFVLIASAVPFFVLGSIARRRRDPRAVMEATVMHTEPELARRALRAMHLAEQTEDEPDRGSPELAQLHFARTLGKVSLVRVAERAAQRAWSLTGVGLVAAGLAFGVVIVDPFRVVEGVDVLAARDGVAPMPVRWVEVTRIDAEPPSYLQLPRGRVRPYLPTVLYVGTTVTVHAAPLRDGRQLVLTDGAREVPFADDGEGTLVAKWEVEGDADVKVAARFGGVVVPEPRGLAIHGQVDHAPFVSLGGAPATLPLLDQPRIPIHWEAQDDHGLREVALVLRAGDEEVRRTLSKPKSGLVDRGGIDLSSDDAFLRDSYLPVEVTVEALDNDPVNGPKWGRSAPLVLMPPQIGEREALRYAALKAARDALIDELARRMDLDELVASTEEVAQKRIRNTFEKVFDDDWGGLRLSGRIAALARGQLERLDTSAKKAIAKRDLDALVGATEEALLAVDSGLIALGTNDTRASSRKLADVAMETATAIAIGVDPSQRQRSERLVNAYLTVLDNGGGFLVHLGRLGRDLGELVDNGVRRIERPLKAGDRYHARLAAEDLAARLRNPVPSFGAAGGGGHGHGGGVESGGMPQPGQGEASEAAEQAAGLEQALEELRQEHEQQMRRVEKALRDALPAEEREAMNQRMRELAQKVRDAVKELPQQASDPGSARASAARARAQAEAMAGALERGDVSKAIEQGEGALQNLDQAQQRGRKAPAESAEREVGDQAGEAKKDLEDLVQQGSKAQQDMQKAASEGASGPLQEAADGEEALAERARKLQRRSQQGQAPLPQAMLDRLGEAARAMERAAKKLGQKQGAEGQKAQREAQRMLEMAQPESESDGPKNSPEGADGRDFARDANVPPEARDKRAEDFRQRVTDGLGREAPPHLKDALRRYTEGLLR